MVVALSSDDTTPAEKVDQEEKRRPTAEVKQQIWSKQSYIQPSKCDHNKWESSPQEKGKGQGKEPKKK